MKPHIAFLPSFGMGHVTPLFQLAKLLVLEYNFQVTFLVITTGASVEQNRFLHSAAAISPDLHIVDLPKADAVLEDTGLVTQLTMIARESIKMLKPILTGLNPIPVALIIDIFTTDAIDVCQDLSIPVYSFFTASPVFLCFSLYLPTLDRTVEGHEFVDPIEIPACKPMCIADLIDEAKDRTNDDYKWFLHHVSRLCYTAGIFVNAWENLDLERFTSLKENPFYQNMQTPPVFPIGPLIKDEEKLTANDAEILVWLDNQPRESVLLVSFGSGGTLSSKQLTELCWGLEMSQQRFILVARNPIDATASGAFFTGGGDGNSPATYLPDGFLEKINGFGIVIPLWAPQVEILRHPSTGAFLSHCGWNSTLESLTQGVPIIAWPLYAEQRMNATMLVEEVGVAVKVPPPEEDVVIGRKDIEKVVRVVMEGEEGKIIRRRAVELKQTAREAYMSGGSSYSSLARVLNVWRSIN